MPTIIRLDHAERAALIEWLHAQVDAAEDAAGDDQAALDTAAAHRALVDHLAQDARAHGPLGQLAEGGLQRLALAYRRQPGYRDDWRP